MCLKIRPFPVFIRYCRGLLAASDASNQVCRGLRLQCAPINNPRAIRHGVSRLDFTALYGKPFSG
jgi:hypothetical protein